MTDMINHPPHYTDGPSCPNCGSTIECITVTERMTFNPGNAVKYIWRAGKKGDAIEDLKKARWYLDREITRLEGELNRPVGGPSPFDAGAFWEKERQFREAAGRPQEATIADSPATASPSTDPLRMQQGHRYRRRDGETFVQERGPGTDVGWPWEGSDGIDRMSGGSAIDAHAPTPLDAIEDLGPAA